MNFSKLPNNLTKPKDDGACNHLLNKKIPEISLPNQKGNLLKLNRDDTFRLIIYCYPMTGNPKKTLPENWNNIPGASGCTLQNCSFRDNYEKFINLNAIPIGVSTQTVDEINEMTNRLLIHYDVLSDANLRFTNILKLPTFKVYDKIFLKRLTLIVKNSVIKHCFYPIFPPDLHFQEVIKWLERN
ncbi:MAG: putative peroxiredoxin bcp [Alphaproteobacteria bacterium MarineAlpha5_Bin6]|nr:MAG: putative peroxiredoxin bcp [Alphaproteobacteria bacterium MarineAlpha5_Bin7]PPR53916.1 MAG: putative peroxiredoxin bcp [Alphaproteobacteria bacterium MarineAlpha5_Bin6]|tara:strand:- start:1158 stop:1712 length:555 start_codon:yes stop_codon:yes gene_type:complete